MKTYLITGTNRGIGLELCKQLSQQGQRVIAVCRKPTPELEKLDVQIEADIDVAQEQAVDQLATRLKNIPIDILINNAGILGQESLDNMDFNHMRRQMEVNAFAPLKVTHAFLSNLKSGSKIIFITSRMGSLGDNTSGSRYGYRMSKAALNMGAISLSQDLKGREIAVGIFHPGMVSTEMTNHQGIPVQESVQQLLMRCQELNLNNSGQFLHANGNELPW